MPRLTVEKATALCVAALTRSRTSGPNAAAVARGLIGAELSGQAGHGLRRLVAYCAQAAAGKVDGFALPQPETVKPGTVAIDAAHGFAFPALELAVDLLPDMAGKQGIAAAGIRRSHHSGVAGLSVEALARQGLVALAVGNSPPAMAPWGARTPLFGTNPIAFAAPVANGDPIVIDVSLSKVARGKIMAARQKGEPIPEGWAFDAGGNPTTDPQAALGGAMAPAGDAKGTALALMVELLCAGLTGANYAHDVPSSFFDDKGPPPGVGQMLIAIDPGCFGCDATTRFAAMATLIEETEGARLPGRRRQALAREILATGIAVDDALLAEINTIPDAGPA